MVPAAAARSRRAAASAAAAENEDAIPPSLCAASRNRRVFRSRPPRGDAGVEVTVREREGEVVVRVAGDAGVAGAGALDAALLRVAALRPALVTIDLSALRSVSALGLGALVAVRRGVVRAGDGSPEARRRRGQVPARGEALVGALPGLIPAHAA